MVMMATLTIMMMIPIQFHVVECGLPNDVVCAAQRDSLRFCVHVPDDDHGDDGDDGDSWQCLRNTFHQNKITIWDDLGTF